MTIHATRSPRRRQAGFTIVEMMVALAIGLVVMFGFSTTFVSMKTAFIAQDQFSQLQDNERFAMTVLTTSLNEAGFFPKPWLGDRSQIGASTDPVGGAMAAGQFISGTPAAAGAPETLSTAYASAAGDGLLTCQGGTNNSGATMSIRNVFYVDAATNALGCVVLANNLSTTQPGSGFQPLVSNVKSMSVLYGVDGAGTGAINKYLTAAGMSPALWSRVKSVRVTLDFINPFAASQPGAPATLQWVQTVNLMNN